MRTCDKQGLFGTSVVFAQQLQTEIFDLLLLWKMRSWQRSTPATLFVWNFALRTRKGRHCRRVLWLNVAGFMSAVSAFLVRYLSQWPSCWFTENLSFRLFSWNLDEWQCWFVLVQDLLQLFVCYVCAKLKTIFVFVFLLPIALVKPQNQRTSHCKKENSTLISGISSRCFKKKILKILPIVKSPCSVCYSGGKHFYFAAFEKHHPPPWKVPPHLTALWCMAMVAAKYIGLWGQISSCFALAARNQDSPTGSVVKKLS